MGKSSKRSSAPRSSDPGTRGPIWTPTGDVLVDPKRCPTLYRAAQAEGARRRAVRDDWAAYERTGDEGLRARLLGVAPVQTRPVGPVLVTPEDGPPEPIATDGGIPALLDQLKRASGRDASRIRAELRRLGHRGGLRKAGHA